MSEFKSGDKVVHPKFGFGVVASVSGSGEQQRVKVDFAPVYGRKELIVALAKLQKVEASSPGHSSNSHAWFEELNVSMKPRGDRRVDRDKIFDQVCDEVLRADFWVAVRERLRASGSMPRVIDNPSGNISVTPKGLLEILIRVRHESIADAREETASRAIFNELTSRILRDFDAPRYEIKSGANFPLIEEDIVFLSMSLT